MHPLSELHRPGIRNRTVSRPDLVAAARDAGDADFDALIACAFNYDTHSSECDKLGRILVLKARMNADLHMADDLKNTGKGNLFVIFGKPDIDILDAEGGRIQVKINGVDVFHPNHCCSLLSLRTICSIPVFRKSGWTMFGKLMRTR